MLLKYVVCEKAFIQDLLLRKEDLVLGNLSVNSIV